jgi:hypothetical protein
MRGAVGLFTSTCLDEIVIFVLSKDQTFRKYSAFENSEQFSILVPHLITLKFDSDN